METNSYVEGRGVSQKEGDPRCQENTFRKEIRKRESYALLRNSEKWVSLRSCVSVSL